MFVAIPVLEEALRVESVALEPVSEGGKDSLGDLSLVFGRLASAVEGLGSHIIKLDINGLLEVLLSEYFIY